MKKLFLFPLVVALSLSASQKSELQNKMASDTIKAVFSGDESTLRGNILQGYIQHAPVVATGLEPTIKAAYKLKGTDVTCPRVFDDGDYTVLHCMTKKGDKEKVSFQIFRFTDGKIIERWVNGTKKLSLNSSSRSQIDGEVKISDLDKTKQNKALIKSFVKDIFFGENVKNLKNYFDKNNYIQHSSAIGDGVDTMENAFKNSSVDVKFQKIHAIFGKGNFVLIITEALFNNKPMSVYDLFRVQNDKIAEHWEVVAPIPPKEKHKNKNGVFGFNEKLVNF